jgi:hypothetical protein
MFEVVCTGENLNYGKDGEKRLLNDNLVLYAIKNNIVYPSKVRYVGSQGRYPLSTGKPESLLPLKKVNLVRTLQMQNNKIDKLIKVMSNIKEVNVKYLKMFKDNEVKK